MNDEINNNQNKRKHWIVRVFIWLLILGVTPFLLWQIFYITASLLTHDIAGIDRQGFEFEEINGVLPHLIPKSENMYYDVVKLDPNYPQNDSLEVTCSDYFLTYKLTNEDYNNELCFQSYINVNIETIQIMRDAYNKPYYQNPDFSKPEYFSIDNRLPPLNKIRDASYLMATQALYSAYTGDVDGGLEELFELAEFGSKLQNSYSLHIEYLIGVAIEKIAIGGMQDIVLNNSVSSTTLELYINKIEKIANHQKGWTKSIIAEYYNVENINNTLIDEYRKEGEELSFVDDLISKKTGSYYNFRPNKTSQLRIEELRRVLEDASKPCHLVSDYKSKNLNSFEILYTENSAGIMMMNFLGNIDNSFHNPRCKSDFYTDSLRLLLAIKLYHLDNGDYPNQLKNLIPEYATEIPQDPFNGLDIGYKKGEHLSSIGLYNTDNEKYDKNDELIFDIEFKE